ncbi:MAG: riboflavin synthase [Ignavibacteriales bacterium]|nr:riboflavin synthase [Ignavibacteriales bacterium]
MFTGIVQEIGKIISKSSFGKGFHFTVSADAILADAVIGDSICVNGVCQTITALDKKGFCFDTVEETVKKTTLGALGIGQQVHLEAALQPQSRMGGHFVLGHVDTAAIIKSVTKAEGNSIIKISYPEEYAPYLTHVCSIAVDGVSLTVASLTNTEFTVSIIPHTWQNTIFPAKKSGDLVNLEFDILGKYVHRMLTLRKPSEKISAAWLKDLGY